MCVGSRAGKTAQLLSWLMPGALLVMASKTLAAQQAAWGFWQVSSDSVWRPTYQSGLQVGACSQACGSHVARRRCLQGASVACWVPACKIA